MQWVYGWLRIGGFFLWLVFLACLLFLGYFLGLLPRKKQERRWY